MLQSIEQLRSVEYARSYCWDIEIPSAPAPFNKWFPAIDVDETYFDVDTHSMEFFMWAYEFPRLLKPTKFSMTFYDDEKGSLRKWLNNWVKVEIFNNGAGCSVLENCLKEFRIKKLRGDKSIVANSSYWVAPDGSFSDKSDSGNSVKQFSASFIIAGRSEISF